jgi:hypothetical protein
VIGTKYHSLPHAPSLAYFQRGQLSDPPNTSVVPRSSGERGKLFYSPYHAVPIGLRVFFIYCSQQEGTAMSRAPSYFYRDFCRDFYCEHSNIPAPRAGKKNRTTRCDHHSLGFCFHVTVRLSLRCDAEQITRLGPHNAGINR